MSVERVIQDSLHLYQQERYHSALCLALIAVDATACKRYGEHGSSGRYIKYNSTRFKTFLNDETKTHTFRMSIGVDLPPQPDIGKPPQFEPLELKDDNLKEVIQNFENFKQQFDSWKAEHREAYREYTDKIPNVGDDFAGRNGSNLGIPRYVSTTGVLYQARCELVHEGKLSAIRILPIDDDSSLRVSGVDPIELSSSWIHYVLGIVVGATENKG